MFALIDLIIVYGRKAICILKLVAPVATRMIMGQMLYFSGHGKLIDHLPDTIQQFTKWGVPMPGLVAPMTATVELVGGLMLFFGLGTRVAALALIGILFGALTTAHAEQMATAWRIWDSSENVPLLNDIAAIPPMAFMLWLFVYGPGWLSVDTLIARAWAKMRQEHLAKQAAGQP
jgi:uncharacterized membrane protein YphA (DoxX/SURF4 family)